MIYVQSPSDLKYSEDEYSNVAVALGCWETLDKLTVEKINSYRHFFMCLHPNDTYRLPLRQLIEIKTPIKSLAERDIDIFFCGEHRKSFNWLNNDRVVACEPASWSRLNMISSSLMIKNKNVVVLPQPHWGGNVSKDNYSDMMSRSKIALCPIGSTWESYRIAEAALYGCIIITTPFDNLLFTHGGNKIPWYFENHPFVFVDRNWNNLVDVVNSLTEEVIERKHKETLEWANKYLTDEAINKRINSIVNSNQHI